MKKMILTLVASVAILTIAQEEHSENTKRPKMGVYLEDITFQKAYELHYPFNYGTRISTVIEGSNADRAGLIDGDIVMVFDDTNIRGKDHLTSLIRSKQIGEMVTIQIFRNEEELSTELTFIQKSEINMEKKLRGSKKLGKFSPGYGGGGPYVKIIDFDYNGINNFITKFNFSKITSTKTAYFGGGGGGNVGKGYFIGGKGFGFYHTEAIPNFDDDGDVDGKQNLMVENSFGGITITKKIPLLTERLVLDLDMMLGGGEIAITIGESNGFSWSFGTISGKYQKFQKVYFAGEASVGLMWRVKKWFGFHGRIGRMETFTLNNQWQESTFDTDKYTVGGDAPEIPSGFTYSAGVWFGF